MSLQQLLHDLVVDRAISAGRAYRHYGVTLGQARGAEIYLVSRKVKRSTSASQAHDCTFLVAETKLTGARDWALRHLAVATAARLDCGASTHDWKNDAARGRASLVPDAEWRKPNSPIGVWAVEADTGSYTKATVREKAEVFGRAYGMQVWAVASEKRLPSVRTILQETGYPSIAIWVPWS